MNHCQRQVQKGIVLIDVSSMIGNTGKVWKFRYILQFTLKNECACSCSGKGKGNIKSRNRAMRLEVITAIAKGQKILTEDLDSGKNIIECIQQTRTVWIFKILLRFSLQCVFLCQQPFPKFSCLTPDIKTRFCIHVASSFECFHYHSNRRLVPNVERYKIHELMQ